MAMRESNQFKVGRSYRVMRLDDVDEVVTIARRSKTTVILTDGRLFNVLIGIAPDSSSEEIFHIKCGQDLQTGVVRACALVATEED